MENALRALADPNRRTLVESLAHGSMTAGQLAAQLPIARPGVSRHLRVLREAGLVEVRADAQRRVYSLRALWERRLDALHTEIERGTRNRTHERRSTR